MYLETLNYLARLVLSRWRSYPIPKTANCVNYFGQSQWSQTMHVLETKNDRSQISVLETKNDRSQISSKESQWIKCTGEHFDGYNDCNVNDMNELPHMYIWDSKKRLLKRPANASNSFQFGFKTLTSSPKTPWLWELGHLVQPACPSSSAGRPNYLHTKRLAVHTTTGSKARKNEDNEGHHQPNSIYFRRSWWSI